MPLKISRILHAGFIFEHENVSICFDPIFKNPFSSNCFAFPSVDFDEHHIKTLCFNAVFISHFHEDHCSLESLNLLDRSTPIYLYCVRDEIFEMIGQLGFQVHRLLLDTPVSMGAFQVYPRQAYDTDVDSLFHIRLNDLNILNVVDSVISEDGLENLCREKWDLILWPFQNMLETEVLSPLRADFTCVDEIDSEKMMQLNRLNPRYVVPSSCQFAQENWSWYNHAMFPMTYSAFEVAVKTCRPECSVVRMNPGTSFWLTKNSMTPIEPLAWVRPVGNQNVDYEFCPSPPPTSEIAIHFLPLNDEQKSRVDTFCKAEIIERLHALPPPAETYFLKPRRWQLSVYESSGKSIDYFYDLKCETISYIERPKDSLPPDWLTEVPAAKLFAALENGESLTSMYVRINDVRFDAKIESELEFVDILDDPLIRALFYGSYGAYQASELKRIVSDAQT